MSRWPRIPGSPAPWSANLVAVRSRSLSIRLCTLALSIVLAPDIHLSPLLVYTAFLSSTLLGSLNPKSNSFLLRKSSRLLSSASPTSADDLENAGHGGALGVVVLVLILADFEGLVAARIRHAWPWPPVRRLAALLGGVVGRGEVHLGVAQFVHQVSTGGAVGAQRARLDDLPFVLRVLAELDGLALGLQFHARQLVLVESQQALVAQVVRPLVEAGLTKLAMVTHLAGRRPAWHTRRSRSGVSSPISTSSVLPSFRLTCDVERRIVQAVGLQSPRLSLPPSYRR